MRASEARSRLLTPLRATAPVIVFALLAAACSTLQSEPPPALDQAGEQTLTNYAFSECLAQSYSDGPLRRDATHAAGAYRAFGAFAPSAYQTLDSLAKLYAGTENANADGPNVSLMKCLDLYNGEPLRQAVRKIQKRSRF